MMKTGKCPKCESTNIYTDGNPKRGDRSSIQVTSWKKFFIDIYICFDCGFTEEYITQEDLKNEKLISRVKEQWKKLS